MITDMCRSACASPSVPGVLFVSLSGISVALRGVAFDGEVTKVDYSGGSMHDASNGD